MPKGHKSEIKRPAFAKPTRWQAGIGRRRAVPTRLYDAFHDVWRFAKILAEHQDIATRYLPDSLVAIELRPGYFCGFYRD